MRPMPELRVEVVPIDGLVPYAGNAKIHDAEQVEQIAESIRQFGNNDPIAVWHNEQGEMEIVEGHGRLMALKLLGEHECPVIYLDHLSDAQRRAYTHIHNQLTMNTGFDVELLRVEIERLGDFDMGLYGFDMGIDISSDEWDSDDAGQGEDDEYGDNDFGQEIFHCLFVYHTDDEAERLKDILGVDKLETTYEMGDLA